MENDLILARRYVHIGLLCAVFNMSSIAVVRAQNAAGNSPTDYYSAAARNLKRGENFEQAIAWLKEAIRLRPTTVSYHLALACAAADRAASVACAASGIDKYTRDVAAYPLRLQEWQAAQTDKSNPLYHTEQPKSPSLKTPDDGRDFSLSKQESITKIEGLYKQFTETARTAVELSRTDDERAEAHYYFGWGMMLAKRFHEYFEFKGSPKDADIQSEFTTAVDLSVKNGKRQAETAIYLQSVGDSIAWDSFLPVHENGVGEALAAYDRSLALNPRNPGLWYRMFFARRKEDTAGAATALSNAAKYDLANAFPLYAQTAILVLNSPYAALERERFESIKARRPFDQQAVLSRITVDPLRAQGDRDMEDSIRLIEEGNQRRRFDMPEYSPPVPSMMAAAWKYGERFGAADAMSPGFWLSISMGISAFGRLHASEGRTNDALRAANCLKDLGERLFSIVDGAALPLTPLQQFFSIAGDVVLSASYTLREYALNLSGDSNGAKQAAAARDAVHARQHELYRLSQSQ